MKNLFWLWSVPSKTDGPHPNIREHGVWPRAALCRYCRKSTDPFNTLHRDTIVYKDPGREEWKNEVVCIFQSETLEVFRCAFNLRLKAAQSHRSGHWSWLFIRRHHCAWRVLYSGQLNGTDACTLLNQKWRSLGYNSKQRYIWFDWESHYFTLDPICLSYIYK